MPNTEKQAASTFWKNVDAVLSELNKAQGNVSGYNGYNDSWLAVNCGVTQASISFARSRGNIPKFETVEKIAEILRVSTSFFLTGERTVRSVDLLIAEEVARIPHFYELAKYLIKMDATQILELLYEAKMICGEKLD